MFVTIVQMLCTATQDAAWDENSVKSNVELENFDAFKNNFPNESKVQYP